MGLLDKVRGIFAPPKLRVVKASQLEPWRYGYHDGTKFPGGYGPTAVLIKDYWTLRARSAELFETNLYARGIIRRLVTNEVHTGLHLEATPEEGILGKPEDSLADWSESTENRFTLWGKDPYLCDHRERMTFGALQQLARQEALVVGDVLVVLQQDPRTRLPRVRLINGAKVQSPLVEPRDGNRIVHGVELDTHERHVAYWITQEDGTSKRLPAIGEKSGRRIAWLMYGTDRRMDDVRGTPLLALVMQSVKEIDRYRDSMQRKALVLSMIAAFVAKGEAKPGTRPITGGAVRRDTATTLDTDGTERSFKIAEHIPGFVIDELQQGEEPKAFQVNGTTEAFGEFEEAILQTVAWANEIPPEILRLAFSSNYSASQAANNEFHMYLNKARTTIGENFCEPIYQEWLVAAVLAGRVDAPGLLEAWRDIAQWDLLGAWVSSDWSGNIKPAVDPLKLANGYEKKVAMGAMTRDRMARELTGTKFSKNVQKLKRENEALRDANMPLAELEAAAKPAAAAPGGDSPPAKDAPDPVETDEDEDEERLPN
jgi:lambda family phage portal protein